MSAIWSELRKQGDFVIVKNTPIRNVRSSVKHWIERNYSRQCAYSSVQLPDGVLVFLAYIPEGTVEAFDARREETRNARIGQLTQLREDGRLKGSLNLIAEDAERKAAIAQALKEIEEAEDPEYDNEDD